MAAFLAWAPAILGAAGQMQAGQEGAAQAAHEEQIATLNEQIETQNAEQARREAAAAEEAKRLESRKSWGRAAAAISQAGIGGPGYGSAGAALSQSAREAELDALNIRYGGETEALSHLTAAAQSKLGARAARRRARGAVTAGIVGAGSELLGGYSSYKTWQRTQRGA